MSDGTRTVPVLDLRCGLCEDRVPVGRMGTLLLCAYCVPAFRRLDEYFHPDSLVTIPASPTDHD